MATDKKIQKYEVPLDGKLNTWDDPAKIGTDFQQLTNMGYTKTHPKSVGGMTKINTTIMNATYFKTRNGIHYSKVQPSESHVLVQAYNTAEDASRILDNTTAIPSAGNFSGTTLYSPSGLHGRWSLAPDGDVAFCDEEETLIWGGNEREVSGFVNYDPDGSFSYDYTNQVRNTLTDSENKAVLNSTAGGIDANVMLLLSLDNNDTDTSPATIHTVTDTNVTYSTTGMVFGTHWAVLTTNAQLSMPDNADFDFSGGTFTVDFHMNLDDLAADYSLYYQDDGAGVADSMSIMVDTNGAVLVRINAGGAKQFAGATDFSTANSVITAGTTYHIEVVESGDNWYIFVDGTLKAYLSDAARAANYTGTVRLGYDSATYLEGKLDEYRVSNSARHTSDFEVPTEAYTTSTTAVYAYIGSLRPLDGIKLYIGTANTSASTMTLYYWDGSAWTEVASLTDGTTSGGKSLAQTGSLSFTSTAANAKVKYIDGVMVYWYKMVITAVSANTSIYYTTVSAPFQEIKDIWDGMPAQIDYFQIYDGGEYIESTLNVRENTYTSADSGSFVELDGYVGGTDYLLCGFSERQMGIVFNFVSGKGNDTAGTVLTVSYWYGDSWISVGTLVDGTLENNVSLGQTGAVTWDNIDPANEFTKTINNDVPLYYYRIDFSKTLGADVQVYYISGIPAQKDIKPYKFPMLANDRLFLCNSVKGKKNSIICSALETSSVFNGYDSAEYVFGDESDIIGGAWIYSQFGSSLYNVTIFFKYNEMWALVGNGPESWVKYKISAVVGCVAPGTIKIIDLGPEQAQTLNRNVVVWQASDGIYMSDGRSPILISTDIQDKFDKRDSGSINLDMVEKSQAVWDNDKKRYHWLWASGTSTTLNEEYVLDFIKPGWFNIDRTSTKDLQAAITVKDTSGVGYNYGFIDTGYMERLEYGNDFDGQDITPTLQFGDMVLANGSIPIETTVQYSCLITTAKTTTTTNITLTHYGDGSTSGTEWTESPTKANYRIIYPVEHRALGSHIFHSVKISTATDNETIGFEPLYFYMLYEITREHLRSWRE